MSATAKEGSQSHQVLDWGDLNQQGYIEALDNLSPKEAHNLASRLLAWAHNLGLRHDTAVESTLNALERAQNQAPHSYVPLRPDRGIKPGKSRSHR